MTEFNLSLIFVVYVVLCVFLLFWYVCWCWLIIHFCVVKPKGQKGGIVIVLLL